MLPSKFFDPPSANNTTNAGRPQRCAPPPLGMTGVMCKIGSLDIPNRGTIQYRIFRPRQLQQKPPLVVLHGGPLIPCNYLLPLAYVVVDRSIVVYDQLGCGQSKTVVKPSALTRTNPETGEEETSRLDVDGMVRDLDLLIKHWKFDKYHLLGHSFGGILLFEYLKYCRDTNSLEELQKCQSAVLASVPTSTAIVEQEVQRLCRELTGNDEEEDDSDDDGVTTLSKKVPKAFREQHECRLVPMPFPLMDSYSQAGPPRLRGLQSIGDYKASLVVVSVDSKNTASEGAQEEEEPIPEKLQQPALILRGQHDFVTETCVEGWDGLFDRVQHMTLAGCSHYGMLENEILYGSVLSSFLGDADQLS
ncbi:Proline iminopeptidase [Seminavis robusta]|uniref:Proline iminopeptidase n=1 Tax=Seminavis robusta TaxID=568900 RepID=A0A9N8H4S0_9STRA|nr:Proline iminopeptidase [Seminavis robusta]|eukprot:Sro70_g038860.1 Proline iminopeptidase (361) ;mRNA; r:51144-52226